MLTNKVIAVIAFMCLEGTTVQASGRTIDLSTSKKDNIITLVGSISGPAVDRSIHQLEKLVASTTPTQIHIVISSPGGIVDRALSIIDLLDRAVLRGHEVNCYVGLDAMSAAFYILAACPAGNRFTLATASLMWHEIRIISRDPLDITTLGKIYSELSSIQRMMDSRTIAAMEISPNVYFKSLRIERIYLASELVEIAPKFLEIVSDIKGVTFHPPPASSVKSLLDLFSLELYRDYFTMWR